MPAGVWRGFLNAEAYRKFHASEEDAWMALDQLT
jgi:hypothetical protein